ncbi:class I SAM-dependent methyltransferase [Lacticaseibacillus jixiensis]|uniref:class I SAM-dependent methyltransferase n=1 Tax=Lacticaseibacillus jixiensis TaxID=3231926 RepID=UPI0036F44D7E
MVDTYPAMHQDNAKPLPTNTGKKQPLWQALAKQAPSLAGKRVLAIHAGDGWFCRYAINHGAIAVLGVDNDAQAISDARAVASNDRLRYRIMPDSALPLLSGPYDLIVGTFDLARDDLHQISTQLSGLLRHHGQLLAAVTTPLTADYPQRGLQLKAVFDEHLTIDSLYQVADKRLQTREQIHFVFSSRSGR